MRPLRTAAAVAALACAAPSQDPGVPAPEPTMQQRLRADVEALAKPGGTRRVGTPGHAEAAAYLTRRLSEVGCAPLVGESFALPYDTEDGTLTNLIGVVPGRDRDLAPVLIGAHYDTCGDQPGADDNAAAVAAALACAVKAAAEPLERDLWVALFDGEEPPHFLAPSMGSIVFYRTQKPREVHAALILDLVGHDVELPGLEHALFSTGMESHPDMLEVFRSLVPKTDLAFIGTRNAYVSDMSDYHVFRLEGRPWLFLSCGRWEHYHQVTDTPDRLNYEKLARVAELSGAALRAMATREFAPFEGEVDTLQTEIEGLAPLARALGLGGRLETREDVTGLVSMLMRQFGL